MTARKQPAIKLEYYVGYEKTDDGYQLYTIYREAVGMLASRGVEFEHDEKEKLMRSTHTIKKLPKVGNQKAGYVVFYDIKKVNKNIPSSVKKAVAADCAELDKIDLKVNALKERYERALAGLQAQEAEVKASIRSTLENRGVVVKRGRFFHRAMLIDDFRVFLKTDFKFAIEPLTAEELMDKAAEVPARFRKLLTSCIKTDAVLIDPKFYAEKLKKKIKPKDRKAFVNEELDVDDEKLEEVLPKIPYQFRLLFWYMNDQIDEFGRHISVLHTKTYNAKNPECQHCGGKFKKNTNVCKDCGLKSFSVEEGGQKTSKSTTKPKRAKAKLRPVRMNQGKPADTRGVPAEGYSRD